MKEKVGKIFDQRFCRLYNTSRDYLKVTVVVTVLPEKEAIIRERGLWPVKGLLAQCEGFKCAPGKTDCCCRRLLFTQPDKGYARKFSSIWPWFIRLRVPQPAPPSPNFQIRKLLHNLKMWIVCHNIAEYFFLVIMTVPEGDCTLLPLLSSPHTFSGPHLLSSHIFWQGNVTKKCDKSVKILTDFGRSCRMDER